MHFASHIGAFVMAPFFLFSGWFGHHTDFHVPPGHATTTATSTATTSPWHWGNDHWKDKDKDKDNHATSTAVTMTLTGIAPAEGAVGSTVTLTGTGFTKESLVHFGPGAVHPITVAANGTSLTFKIPSAIGPYCKPTQACPMYLARIVTQETYKVYVFNEHATTTAMDFRVTASASTTVDANLHVSL
jgi:hypothetical protein